MYVQPAHIIPVMWGWALQPRPRPSHDCKILASLCIELQAFKLYTQSHSYLLGIFSHKKCSRTLQGQISKNRQPGTKTVSYLFYILLKRCTVFMLFRNSWLLLKNIQPPTDPSGRGMNLFHSGLHSNAYPYFNFPKHQYLLFA